MGALGKRQRVIEGQGRTDKRFAVFTDEQQEAFNGLTAKQQKFVEFVGQGYKKIEAWKMAGFGGKNMSQAVWSLENRRPEIVELCDVLKHSTALGKVVKGDKEAEINVRLTTLAAQKTTYEALKKLDDCDIETARRIKFYRDIVNGEVMTVKHTIVKNGLGEVLKDTTETVSDVNAKMQARKELDRILGLNAIVDIGKIDTGDITINIVDASKREELEDSRNKVVLDPDNVVVVDGKEAVVVDEREQVVKDGRK